MDIKKQTAGPKQYQFFDENWYLAQYPDVALTNLSPAEHYLKVGIRLGRKPNAYAASQPQQVASTAPSQCHVISDSLKLLAQLQPGFYYQKLETAICYGNEVLLCLVQHQLNALDFPRLGQKCSQSGPLVSIIMPTYNRATIIAEAIDSVLAQSYTHFELLICDDASTDNSNAIVSSFRDKRIRWFKNTLRRGAAAARNRCLEHAQGHWIAYLDSDNLWHPKYLEIMLEHLENKLGYLSAYADYLHIAIDGQDISISQSKSQSFQLEDQLEKPFVDLNSFMHLRQLYELFGGFDENLERLQDKDLILRYCWTQKPLQVPYYLNLYQHISSLETITSTYKDSPKARERIRQKTQHDYQYGQAVKLPDWLKKVTIIACDKNPVLFAKACRVAEALSRQCAVQLLVFSFAETPWDVLPGPSLELSHFRLADAPDFSAILHEADASISADLIYCAHTQLVCLGLALWHNARAGTPIFLELDSEALHVSSVQSPDLESALATILKNSDEPLRLYADNCSQLLATLREQLPVFYTDRSESFGGHHSLSMHNVSDETIYKLGRYHREKNRQELGFSASDKVILLAAPTGESQDIIALMQLLKSLGDPGYRLMLVGYPRAELRLLAERLDCALSFVLPETLKHRAAICQVADIILFWSDATPGSWQGFPTMTEALAMGATVISSAIPDLLSLSQQGVIWTVAWGDYQALKYRLLEVLGNRRERQRRTERARKLFLREFSYLSVPTAIALGSSFVTKPKAIYPVARDFYKAFLDCIQSHKA